ncbi:hypothetical protein LCGC14_2191830 [marine sediment metagenome]|uniref:Uncharacterized protein n=1 Tax=marine sediment metagenome TaxID=412755 RepID=A0A0F9DJD6_9ZZZZ
MKMRITNATGMYCYLPNYLEIIFLFEHLTEKKHKICFVIFRDFDAPSGLYHFRRWTIQKEFGLDAELETV